VPLVLFVLLVFCDVRMRTLSEMERVLVRISKRKEEQRIMKNKSRDK
jgi:hypothetical protein